MSPGSTRAAETDPAAMSSFKTFGATTLAVVVSIIYTLFRAQPQQYQNSLHLPLHGVGVVACMDYSRYWKSLYT
ncbi:hypothetical protein XACLE3_8790003 [Xanthomonas citri pv. citri]|nr:hypothetical protein XACLE3_8790003 [Xanthomonas citri pv. citri]